MENLRQILQMKIKKNIKLRRNHLGVVKEEYLKELSEVSKLEYVSHLKTVTGTQKKLGFWVGFWVFHPTQHPNPKNPKNPKPNPTPKP